MFVSKEARAESLGGAAVVADSDDDAARAGGTPRPTRTQGVDYTSPYGNATGKGVKRGRRASLATDFAKARIPTSLTQAPPSPTRRTICTLRNNGTT